MTILFGEFDLQTFGEAIVYSVDETVQKSAADADEYANEVINSGKHSAYLIPSLFEGVIKWEEGAI